MSDRLAVNGRFLSQATTGTQRYALELVTRLVERHPGRVVLHVPRGTEVPPALAAVAQVQRSRARGQVFEQVVLPWAVRGSLLLSLGGPAPLAARRQVATIHDVSVFRHPVTYSRTFRTWYRAMYRVLARRAARVLTVSQFSAAEIAAVLHVNPSRLSVVPNGADHVDRVVPTQPDAAAYPVLTSGRPWVLCVGTFARHKNLGPALDALEAAGIASVVVGARGSGSVFAEAEAERWQHAHLAGRLSDEELVWLYGHAAALVFPSLYEGFGIPVIEAQRLGCPVIALDTGPMREVGGDAVLLCDPQHPEAVVGEVRRLLDEEGLREATVAAGRTNAARFGWDSSTDRLEQALAQVGWS